MWLGKHTSALQILLRACPFLDGVSHLGTGWTPFSWFCQVLQLALCLRHRTSFSKVSIRFIFVIFTLRRTTFRNSSTLFSLIYYKPWQNSNELVMSLLHVREEHSPVSLSEKKTSCPVNIRTLVMAYGTMSGNKCPSQSSSLSFHSQPSFYSHSLKLSHWVILEGLRSSLCKGDGLKLFVWEELKHQSLRSRRSLHPTL